MVEGLLFDCTINGITAVVGVDWEGFFSKA